MLGLKKHNLKMQLHDACVIEETSKPWPCLGFGMRSIPRGVQVGNIRILDTSQWDSPPTLTALLP